MEWKGENWIVVFVPPEALHMAHPPRSPAPVGPQFPRSQCRRRRRAPAVLPNAPCARPADPWTLPHWNCRPRERIGLGLRWGYLKLNLRRNLEAWRLRQAHPKCVAELLVQRHVHSTDKHKKASFCQTNALSNLRFLISNGSGNVSRHLKAAHSSVQAVPVVRAVHGKLASSSDACRFCFFQLHPRFCFLQLHLRFRFFQFHLRFCFLQPLRDSSLFSFGLSRAHSLCRAEVRLLERVRGCCPLHVIISGLVGHEASPALPLSPPDHALHDWLHRDSVFLRVRQQSRFAHDFDDFRDHVLVAAPREKRHRLEDDSALVTPKLQMSTL